jgi:spermidine synthase
LATADASSPAVPTSGALRPAVALPVSLALVSAAALVVEIVAGRLLAPYVGMSLYTWTAIIAVVLAGLSVGHWLGGVLDPGDERSSYHRLALALALAALTTALAPALVRAFSDTLLGAGLPPLLAISALVAALFLAPSLFAGTVSPILTRLALDASPHERSRVLGRMFAAGALGSIAGTVLAGFVLIAWVGTLGTLLGVAAAEALLSLAFLAAARPGRRRIAVTALASAGACAALLLAWQRSDALTSPCTVESSYFCIRVLDYEAESGRPSRLMVIDHMAHGVSDRDEPRWLHGSYTALTDRLVRLRGIADRPFSAFFVGGGAYTVPRAWLAAFPDATLTVAEIDPAVTAAAREHFWLSTSPRLRIVHDDARRVLEALPSEARFDVVMGDAFHDLSVPAHLTTVEFAKAVHGRLRDGGTYLMHVLDLAAAPRFLLAEVRTLLHVFPAVEVWVDEQQWSSGGRITFLVLASSRSSPGSVIRGQSPDDLAEGRAWRRLPDAALRRAALAPEVITLVDDHAPVDRLMQHVMERDP